MLNNIASLIVNILLRWLTCKYHFPLFYTLFVFVRLILDYYIIYIIIDYSLVLIKNI